MLEHVIDTAASLNPESIHVVVGHMAELVEQMVNGLSDDLKKLVKIDLQKEQLGTGHAVSITCSNIGLFATLCRTLGNFECILLPLPAARMMTSNDID